MNELIKEKIAAAVPDAQIFVQGDGRHFEAVVVSGSFEEKSTLERQRLIYQVLSDAITRGDVHALSLKTFTPTEWEQANG